jgi:hypothetical protein
MADDSGALIVLDDGGVDHLGEMGIGELFEDTREDRLAGELRGELPATDATEFGGGFEEFDHSTGGGEVVDGLEDEGASDGGAILEGTTRGTEGRGRDMIFDTEEFEDSDELLLFEREFADNFGDIGEEIMLDTKPDC